MSQARRYPRQITQIMPAEGWYMKSEHGEPGSSSFHTSETRLVCWAACVDDEGPFVTGMLQAPGSGDLIACSIIDRVNGYSYKP